MFQLVDGCVRRGPNWKKPTTKEEALQASIAKWEFITLHLKNGVEIRGDGGKSTCGLCGLYWESTLQGDIKCDGCPVAEAGHTGCKNTPYDEFDEWTESDAPESEGLEIANKEIAFLKSLQ
jgi:hypothetical protein